jgi:hypothetical protein
MPIRKTSGDFFENKTSVRTFRSPVSRSDQPFLVLAADHQISRTRKKLVAVAAAAAAAVVVEVLVPEGLMLDRGLVVQVPFLLRPRQPRPSPAWCGFGVADYLKTRNN